MELDSSKLGAQELATRLNTQADLLNRTAQLLHLAIGGDAVSQDLKTLYALLQANIASDTTTAADLLTKINEAKTIASAATVSGQLARNVADQALTTTQTQATTLVDLGQKVAGKLPLSGGTMTGSLNVLAPTTGSNPLQYNSLPLSMTFKQNLPLIALGGLYSFTVTVANSEVGQVVILNLPLVMLQGGAFYQALVTSPGVVTIYLKAGVAIAAGEQSFLLRVLR